MHFGIHQNLNFYLNDNKLFVYNLNMVIFALADDPIVCARNSQIETLAKHSAHTNDIRYIERFQINI